MSLPAEELHQNFQSGRGKPAQVQARSQPRRKQLRVGLALGGAILLIAIIAIAVKWPFSREAVARDLGRATSAHVQFARFRTTLFPPGCVAEGVEFRRAGSEGTAPLITIRKLSIKGSYSGMLRHYVPLMQAEGAHVTLPPIGGASKGLLANHASRVHIGKVQAENSVLEIEAAGKGEPATRFAIHHFAISGLGGAGAMNFEAALTNPQPHGEISARGQIGPWAAGDLALTPAAGSYSFRHADLATIGGIAGTLASDGKFEGTIRALHVTGDVEVPDFQVRRSTHRTQLRSHFQAIVDGTNGNVTLQEARSRLALTTVDAAGEIAARGHDQRSAALTLEIPQGRVQDVLLLFIRAPKAPMSGVAGFRGKALIPSGPRPFVERIVMEGDFGVNAGHFTSGHTQQSLDKLSAKARGNSEKDEDDPSSVLSDLKGHAVLRDATVTFTGLQFRVPGALAKMHGTYNFETERINLRGTLLLEQKLSKTSSGIKSVLLKALDPFLKKNKGGGAKMPVRITGTYSHPHYSTDPI
jgi:hypothetical protein